MLFKCVFWLQVAAVMQANHGPSIYDRLYSHQDAPDNTDEFDKILMRIQGGYNGLSKADINPYKKSYVNGTTRRKSSLFGSSSESGGDRRPTKIGDSSSEDERYRQKPLGRLQREVGRSLSEDSDDLLPLPRAAPVPSSRLGGHIYSDTDSDNSLHDDHNSTLKTKGALKSFTGADRKKGQRKAVSNADKENIKSSKPPREVIVPERTAAKKATEHIRGSSKRKRDDNQAVSSDEKDKEKVSKFVKTVNKVERGRTPREDKVKETALGDKDNLLGYVPQREAAKKATETIKSGLKPQEEAKLISEKKREEAKKREEEEAGKASSSSSSSSCSSSSSSDSSTETEEEKPKAKSVPKSIFDPEPISRKEDWPFLDKEPQSNSIGDKKFKKAPDKKLKTSDGRPEIEFQPPTLTREEPRTRGSGDRVRSSGARPRDLPEAASPSCEGGKRKPAGPLPAEHCETSRNEPSASALPKTEEIDSRLRRKSSRNAELVKEPPPESPVKQKKDELPVKRGPGRPRRTSTRGEAPELSSPKNKARDKVIPSEEEPKPKAKPMPRSVKKALGLLDDGSPEKKEVIDLVGEDDKVGVVSEKRPIPPGDKRSDLSEKNFDKDKFRRSLRLLSEEVETRVPSPTKLTPDNNNEPTPKEPPEVSKPMELVDVPEQRTSPTLDLGLEAEAQKAARSIFSPQPNRDNLADILDFEDDISAVDETVHEERPLGLFNFNNDLLFREDSKEDSKRETYNLVEKLRMDYAKKCGTQEAGSPLSKDGIVEGRDEKMDVGKSCENGLSQSETATDSQGPPPTPGCHLDSQPLPSGKYSPNSQDSHTSLNKSTDSPASQNYQQQNTPLTPLSQTYQQQHTPQTPSSQNYQQQHTPQTPSSQNYQQGTPQTPYMQHNTPHTPYMQHAAPLTPTSYPQTPLSQNYQPPQTPSSQPYQPSQTPSSQAYQPPQTPSQSYPPPQTPSSQPYQPATGLTPQAFTNSQASIAGGYTPSTPHQGFPSTAALDAATAAAFNGTPAFPPSATVYPTGTPYDGIYEACASSIRDSAKVCEEPINFFLLFKNYINYLQFNVA